MVTTHTIAQSSFSLFSLAMVKKMHFLQFMLAIAYTEQRHCRSIAGRKAPKYALMQSRIMAWAVKLNLSVETISTILRQQCHNAHIAPETSAPLVVWAEKKPKSQESGQDTRVTLS